MKKIFRNLLNRRYRRLMLKTKALRLEHPFNEEKRRSLIKLVEFGDRWKIDVDDDYFKKHPY
jgi:hypothetical protein